VLGGAKEKTAMKILIYRAGVLGSLYAARLQVAGPRVALLARGERMADLRGHGIVLEDARTGQRTTTNIEVVTPIAWRAPAMG
jgi:2-dehydropantoate 2-reductase